MIVVIFGNMVGYLSAMVVTREFGLLIDIIRNNIYGLLCFLRYKMNFKCESFDSVMIHWHVHFCSPQILQQWSADA